MAYAATDKFIYTAPMWTGTIGSGGVANDSVQTIGVASATGLTNGKTYIFSIDRVNGSGTKTPTKREVCVGVLSGTDFTNCVRGSEGTAQAHDAGATVEVLMTAEHWNRLIDGLLVGHGLDGAHNASLALTSPVLTTPQINDTSSDHQYVYAVSELTADRTVTLPLLTGNDEFVFKAHTQTLTNKTVVQKVTSYTPDAAGTATLNLTTGNIHSITMPAGNITIAVSNEATGQCFLVEITQDSGGSRTVTWFDTIKWAGGSAPTLTTTGNKRDVFGFRVTGTDTYDGFVVGQNL